MGGHVTQTIAPEEQDALDQKHLEAFGYPQKLRRTMGGYTSFAVSFSFISVTTGLFANYGFGLSQAGRLFIWTWIAVSIGQLGVALCFAHIAPRVPVCGYSYQWASKLVSHKFGWYCAWFAIGGWLTGTAGVAYAFASYFAPYVGLGDAQLTIVIVTVLLLFVYLGIQLTGMRFSGRVNNVSVVTEIVGTTLVGAGLLIYILIKHPSNFGLLTSSAGAAPGSYLAAFAVSALVGMYTLTGFDGAADLAEETKNPSRSVPRAIIRSEVISAVVGFVVLLGFTVAIPNLAGTQASGTPLLYIMQNYLGPVFTPIAMVMVFISIFACGLINLAAVSRLVFSLGRDGVLPGSKFLSTLSGTRSPQGALIACTVIAALFTIVAKVESVITSVGAASDFMMYALVIVAALIAKRDLRGPEGSFTLGRWFKPIAVATLIWIAIAEVAVTVPPINHVAGIGMLVVFALGVFWYFVRVRNMPAPPQPGATDDVTHAMEADIYRPLQP
jgi:amino acid transporter